jgi:hypothetical protein
VEGCGKSAKNGTKVVEEIDLVQEFLEAERNLRRAQESHSAANNQVKNLSGIMVCAFTSSFVLR